MTLLVHFLDLVYWSYIQICVICLYVQLCYCGLCQTNCPQWDKWSFFELKWVITCVANIGPQGLNSPKPVLLPFRVDQYLLYLGLYIMQRCFVNSGRQCFMSLPLQGPFFGCRWSLKTNKDKLIWDLQCEKDLKRKNIKSFMELSQLHDAHVNVNPCSQWRFELAAFIMRRIC